MNENCKNILNKMNVKYGGLLDVGHLFPYKTDGLVFHPNNLAVFQTTMDSYISNPFVSKGKRWNNNYKWKAQDHLTIDFKIKIINYIIYKFMYFHKELSASVSYMVMDEQKAWLISVTSFFLLYLFFSPTTVFLWSEKVALLFLS